MELLDKNQSLVPPEGYELQDINAVGAYLKVRYRKPLLDDGFLAESRVTIYLNDMGREVARSISKEFYPPSPVTIEPPPVGRKFRFANGWYTILEGLQEMIKCLKK